MRIGVFGAGNLGSVLGRRFASAGHDVCFGVRNMESPRTRLLRSSSLRGIRMAGIAETARSSHTLVLAVPPEAIPEVLRVASPWLGEKTLIDATALAWSNPDSTPSLVKNLCPSSHLVRSFHYQGYEVYEQPRFGDMRPDLFYCSPDIPKILEQMQALACAVDMRPVRIGGLEQVWLADSLGSLWMALALGSLHNRHIAFQVLQ